jgi:predicted amidohydrolase YtcJ
MVLLDGEIFTAVAGTTSFAEALAITGDRISAVGTTQRVFGLAGPRTRVIDLGGRLAIPGLNDAHAHFSPRWVGRTLPFKGMEPAWEEVLEAVGWAVRHEPAGTVVSGAIGADAFFDPRCTSAKLTEVAPVHPVMLRTWTSHAAILNRAMSRRLGVDEEAPPVLGGFFGKDMRGTRWDGVVHEYAAIGLQQRLHDGVGEEAGLRRMLDDCARWGLTSVQLMSLPNDPQRLVEMLAVIDPPVRVRVIPMPLTGEKARPRPGHPLAVPPAISDRVRVDGLKWLLDGTPVERSAAQRKPYADDPGWSGVTTFSGPEIRAVLEEVRGPRTQLIVHAVGDRAIEELLEAMEDDGGGPEAWADRRVRIEHGDGMLPDLVPRARRLGVVVVVNPTHLRLDPLSRRRFGAAEAGARHPVRSLMDAGVPLAIGSDGAMNPFLDIMLVSLYSGRPEEALTREEAVRAYTAASAYAEFEDDRKGTIEVGKLADIAVLSQNILEVAPSELPMTESVLTIVGGRVVHSSLG